MQKKLKTKEIESHIQNMDVDTALKYLHKLQEEYNTSLDRLVQKIEKKKAALEKEVNRYKEMCKFENEAYTNGYNMVAGVDEAGRGPLAGPVVAASVILPRDVFIEGLNDSKKLSAQQRERLYDVIIEKAVAYEIGIADEKCIDEINILNATKRAMEKAINNLKPQPEIILIDAVSLENIKIKQTAIIKGDSLSVSIAAASVIAKVTRDRLIDRMDSMYPQYGFLKHKGYGTKEHIEAIKRYGICPIHRVSFTRKFTV